MRVAASAVGQCALLPIEERFVHILDEKNVVNLFQDVVEGH